MLTRLALLLMAVLLVSASVAAAGPGQCEHKQSESQIEQDQNNLASTKLTLKRLTHAVDLWHDANLKGDRTAIEKCEMALQDLMEHDLDLTQAQLSQDGKAAAQSALGFKRGARSWSEQVDDQNDLGKEKQLFGAKKRLANTWANSDAFSNKYRLINDYLDVLRRQTGTERIQLAEDTEELPNGR